MFTNEQEVQERAFKLDKLLESLESSEESPTRDAAVEAIQTLLDLYGDGLARISARLRQRDRALLDEVVEDSLVSHLLMVHGLHPVSVEARVMNALDTVRPYLESHGGGVEFLGVAGGVVRLRLQGTCETCPASTVTLKLAVEDAIYKAAPDVVAINAEGLTEQAESEDDASSGYAANGPGASPWTTIGDLSLTPGGMRTIEVDGTAALFLNVNTQYYAYRNRCPVCGSGLSDGALVDKYLSCPSCQHQFDVRRAGRSLSDHDLHLEPVPLIMDGNIAQIAVPAL